MERRVRPRDAASLVIVRRRGMGHEVLMGRRPSRDRFLPDIFVFPGGGVDPADRSAEIVGDLPALEAQRIRPQASLDQVRALAVAAIRETFEETGLVFGTTRGERIFPDLGGLQYIGRAITPAQSLTRYHARFFLENEERATGRLRSNGELIDMQWLSFPEAARLPTIDVTRMMLEQARRRLERGADQRSLMVHYRGARMIRREE
jgi:8-oxo-dGTP pyrophosphatase MutT (NUDIX family)